uniref:Uncharacterized protein n=1 Tax=Sphaerodactylus townsendi TaxID=933632 RepID=A0ACB8ECI1_9SAUR
MPEGRVAVVCASLPRPASANPKGMEKGRAVVLQERSRFPPSPAPSGPRFPFQASSIRQRFCNRERGSAVTFPNSTLETLVKGGGSGGPQGCPLEQPHLRITPVSKGSRLQACTRPFTGEQERLGQDYMNGVGSRVWLTTQNHSTLVTERSAVPFLPVNPEYSATRNQGRQKLARFNAREFATLIIDILSEAKRRQQGKGLVSPTETLDSGLHGPNDVDDQHDYDSVASDEDPDQEPLRGGNAARNNRARSMDSSDLSGRPHITPAGTWRLTVTSLRHRSTRGSWTMRPCIDCTIGGIYGSEGWLHPRSMPFPPIFSLMSCQSDESYAWETGPPWQWNADRLRQGGTYAQHGRESFPGSGARNDDLHPEPRSPWKGPWTQEAVRRASSLKAGQGHKNIQELLRAAQRSSSRDSFVPCSEKIHMAVTEMASLFPKKPALETVRSSLRLLNASAYRLQSECRKTVPPEPGAPVDYQLLTQQVIQCAYDIAKAAKQLVTITTREKKQ